MLMLPIIWKLHAFSNSCQWFSNDGWLSNDLQTIAMICKPLPAFSNPISVWVTDHMETTWVCKRAHIQSRVVCKHSAVVCKHLSLGSVLQTIASVLQILANDLQNHANDLQTVKCSFANRRQGFAKH